jgi:UDP-GlcNAc:undecaprenyl-phosphate GlcNAc-1-phosphate transferase
LIFVDIDKKLIGILLGATLIVLTGIIDDKYNMKASYKFLLQIAAGVITVLSGVQIEMINFFGRYLPFGPWSGVVTVVWIVALTNAINLIDGLDGLSCGVSTISCFTLLISLAFHLETPYFVLLLIGILAGSCLGFLPFNFNPAKIFMGDTGALFLGYIMSVLSILGCFKLDALVSFWVPFLIFALPLLDTAFAFIRRILKGKSPFSADRGHVHHRLIDKGFDQRHSVLLLYAISGISGISAILISLNNYVGGAAMFVVAVTVLILNLVFGTDKSGFANSRSNNSPDASSGNNTDAE